MDLDIATAKMEKRSWYSSGDDKGYDFVVDRDDLGNDGSALSSSVKHQGIKTPDTEFAPGGEEPVLPYTFFTSMPEYVDYAFYVDVLDPYSTDRKLLDRRVQRMAGEVHGFFWCR